MFETLVASYVVSSASSKVSFTSLSPFRVFQARRNWSQSWPRLQPGWLDRLETWAVQMMNADLDLQILSDWHRRWNTELKRRSMLTVWPNSSYKDGIILAAPKPPDLYLHYNFHCSELHALAWADEFHSNMRSRMFRFVSRRQFSYRYMFYITDIRLSLFS